jgi:hypothetical protein
VYPVYNKERRANCIGHIMCRHCVLKHVIEGKIEGGGRSYGMTQKEV